MAARAWLGGTRDRVCDSRGATTPDHLLPAPDPIGVHVVFGDMPQFDR